jgi:hypothetical protein
MVALDAESAITSAARVPIAVAFNIVLSPDL